MWLFKITPSIAISDEPPYAVGCQRAPELSQTSYGSQGTYHQMDPSP